MKVSICTVTYNHEKFIAQAIESFLSQNAKFDFEIVIGDDNSSDGTPAIVKYYEGRYPNKIKFFQHPSNRGMIHNFRFIYHRCIGKYIAMCDGDDYWTDESKLQKQVAFMEANPDFAICYHRVNELLPGDKLMLENINTSNTEQTYTIQELAKGNLIHTPSVLFRNNLFESFPNWFAESPVGDYVLHMVNARYGKIKYFPEPMAVYRRHAGGVWSTQSRMQSHKAWIKLLDYLLLESFDDDVKEALKTQRRQCVTAFLQMALNERDSCFGGYLQEFMVSDPVLQKEWLIIHFPRIIAEMQTTATNIQNSNSYRYASRLAALKKRIFGSLLKA